MTTEFLVRLKPRPAKKRKGVPQTPSRYMIEGVRFEEAKGWYRIKDAAFAERLRDLTHNDREDGVSIFDVATPREAEAIQARERRAKVRRDVEDADVQTVAPKVTGRALRSKAVRVADVTPEAEPEPAMIDGADGDEDEPEADEPEALGKLEGAEQELDDGDDLLEAGGREPRPPKVTPTPAAKPQPRTRKAAAPAKKAKPAKA
jgi:hypothetical protein